MTSENIIEEAVRKFWLETGYAQDVIAFFFQKYSFETTWENCQELASPEGSYAFASVVFQNDFCEGQTDVTGIHIVPLDKVTEYYYKNVLCQN